MIYYFGAKSGYNRYMMEPVRYYKLPHHWMHDPEVTKYNSHGLFNYTEKDADGFRLSIESHDCIAWDIFDKDITKEATTPWAKQVQDSQEKPRGRVGRISLQSINWINRSAELAIVLGQGRGSGVGTAAVAEVLKHAKDKLGLHRVWTGTAATNKGMQRVCEKNGFKLEGTFKDGMFLNGRFVDVLAYGKIL